MNNLLPPNATLLERRMAQALAQRIDALPAPQRALWNADTCPARLLPYLAWMFSVDQWNSAWPEEKQRHVIKESIKVHQHKGTRGAVLRMLAAIFVDTNFVLVEGANAGMYDGSVDHDGSHYYGLPEHWAVYNVYINRAITLAAAAEVRAVLARTAPARCHLQYINFQQALHAYDGSFLYDGIYSHGVA